MSGAARNLAAGPPDRYLGGYPLSKTLSIANDGYNYSDAGSAPEDTPTGEPIRRSQTTVSDEIESYSHLPPSQKYEDIALRIFSRPIEGAWRARVSTTLPSTTQRLNEEDSESREIRDIEILHNWTREGDRDETHLFLNVLNRGPPSSVRQVPEKVGHIRWIHANQHVLSHAGFEKLVSEKASHYLAPGIVGLTRRLLKRVRKSDERHFVGGKFLLPTAIRYDGQSKASNEVVRSCTFFNFPYLSLENHRAIHCKRCKEAGDDGHPKRTLLQSRYRLERTVAKDESQSITTLKPADIAKCVKPSNKQNALTSSRGVLPIVYVPQLWVTSLSGDVMVTSGPLSELELQSKIVKTVSTSLQQHHDTPGPPLVHILLDNLGKRQRFTYPTDQCDWWFGLLSKQRQILWYLGKSEKDQRAFGSRSTTAQSGPPTEQRTPVADYKFYTTENSGQADCVTIKNWLQLLGQASSKERLDLWLKPDVPSVVVTSAVSQTDSSTLASQHNLSASPSHSNVISTGTSAPTPTIGPSSTASSVAGSSSIGLSKKVSSHGASESSSQQTSIDNTVFLPFFLWPLVDDLGEDDNLEADHRALGKLDEVYDHICGRYSHLLKGDNDHRVLSSLTRQGLNADASTYTMEGVTARLRSQTSLLDDQQRQTMEAFIEHCHRLLQMFIPGVEHAAADLTSPLGGRRQRASGSTHQSMLADHKGVNLFWSFVGGLLDYTCANPSWSADISQLTGGLKEIQRHAEEIHLGTCTLRDLHPGQGEGKDQVVPARSKVLLEVIVDALKMIFEVLPSAVQCLQARQGSRDRVEHSMISAIDHLIKQTCTLLETAKDRLIAEADDIIHDKGQGPGPVVTPEAILIMLLDRLSRGVYEDGTADIMDLYEKIVEKIALKVERSASRRLLLEINRLSEELEIIFKVLRQQKSILLMYRHSLDPETYNVRSIPRQMNFEHESKFIDRIIKAVQGRIVDCSELVERARRLAEQNVQLVETQQDDNSKAIMIFTIVTVTFLPPSFVSSYFGMNLKGINNTDSGPAHFWEISAPLTFGVVVVCLLSVYLSAIKRKWKLRKEKMT